MFKVAIYLRVSTNNQTTDNQLQELQNIVKRNNWEVVVSSPQFMIQL